jgi:hypothetical protein
MWKKGMPSYFKLVALTFFALFVSCEKKQIYTLPSPNSSTNNRPYDIVITSIEVINCNLENCINQDADLKPDLYLIYNYKTSSTYDAYTDVKPNVSENQFPIRFTLSVPIRYFDFITEELNIKIMDLDTGTPGTGTSDLLGTTKFTLTFNQYFNLLDTHSIGDSASTYFYSQDTKAALKLNLLYK